MELWYACTVVADVTLSQVLVGELNKAFCSDSSIASGS